MPKILPEFNIPLEQIFGIDNEVTFNRLALEVFHYQSRYNIVYRDFLQLLGKNTAGIKHYSEIPCLPISFFKTARVISGQFDDEIIFTSSGTTGMVQSKHHVKHLAVYHQSFLSGFRKFYGNEQQYCFLCLLPSYQEREGSSLLYMMQELIKLSGHPLSGFYQLHHQPFHEALAQSKNSKTILLGVSYALLDLAEHYPQSLGNIIVMDTGGMKGRRKEITREELYSILKNKLGVAQIHSEYGMTELLSQAYAQHQGRYMGQPWMKILTKESDDPLSNASQKQTGMLHIIDLANIHSCAFIATSDIGKVHDDGSFEVLGRADYSDIRGCNLLLS